MTFVPLVELEVERVGFGPQSAYVEYCLLPLIGPTCWALYRRVAPLVCAAGPVEVDLGELGRNLGLGPRAGPGSAVMKALARLEMFHLGAWRGQDRYTVRRAVAPLGDRQAQRLPEPARSIHYRSVAHSPTTARLLPASAGRPERRP